MNSWNDVILTHACVLYLFDGGVEDDQYWHSGKNKSVLLDSRKHTNKIDIGYIFL